MNYNNKNNKKQKKVYCSKKNNRCVAYVMLGLCMMALISMSGCGEEKMPQGETYANSPLAANAKQAAQQANAQSSTQETRASHQYGDVDVDNSKATITIGEKLFLTQINDIYNNFNRYEGKTIAVEGMLGNYSEWDDSFQNAVVYRSGPGCCGNDGWGGFFLTDMKLKLDGDIMKYTYEKTNEDIEIDDWLKVTGKPALYQGKDSEGTVKTYLFLEIESLVNTKDKDRGAEYVAN